ncbi:MAG: hypothetical protein KAI27_06785 [Rhodospirillaceae bacterium]|nr:hypothetical protein [Rhodospirillaceae bacterium]
MAIGTYLKTGVAALAILSLGACSTFTEGAFNDNAFWADGPIAQNDQAELGLAELAKGNNVAALAHFNSAIKINPKDVHALFGAALVHQNNGRPDRARSYYRRILMISPQPKEEIMIWAGSQPQSINELANINLTLIDGPSPQSSVVDTQTLNASGAMPKSQMYVAPSVPSMASNRIAADEIRFADADVNIVERFKTMRSLAEQGLITQGEFSARRQVNIGALLPLSSNPPAAGLDRSVPPASQISNRLRAISRALEMQAISVSQHSSERTMILDALMPARPANVAMAPLAPKDLMSAADAVRRLEFLKQADIITGDEYARERAAIEGSMQMQPAVAMQPSAQMQAPQMLGSAPAPKKMSGFQPGVHLASYRQIKAAERGWKELQVRFSSRLGGLEKIIERVDLGSPKGVFYRLKAGPLSSNNEAIAVCKTLKQKRQYCDPTTINFN